jgi:hypothetical protein
VRWMVKAVGITRLRRVSPRPVGRWDSGVTRSVVAASHVQ